MTDPETDAPDELTAALELEAQAHLAAEALAALAVAAREAPYAIADARPSAQAAAAARRDAQAAAIARFADVLGAIAMAEEARPGDRASQGLAVHALNDATIALTAYARILARRSEAASAYAAGELHRKRGGPLP